VVGGPPRLPEDTKQRQQRVIYTKLSWFKILMLKKCCVETAPKVAAAGRCLAASKVQLKNAACFKCACGACF